ncbi:MAG: hypothetical protein AAF394_04050 [Planctomycetota bacterium]
MPDSSSDLENPYAISTNQELHSEEAHQHELGCWREGNLLVLHVDADFPPLCVKTGEAVFEPGIRRTFVTHPSFGLSSHARKAEFMVPLAPNLRRRRRNLLRGAWFFALVAMMLFAGAVIAFETHQGRAWAIFSSFVILILAFAAGQDASRILVHKKVTKEFAYFRGVHHSILDQLEEFPYRSQAGWLK